MDIYILHMYNRTTNYRLQNYSNMHIQYIVLHSSTTVVLYTKQQYVVQQENITRFWSTLKHANI